MKSSNIISDLKNLSNKDEIQSLQRFFKTDKGEYGAGDKFIGVRVPDSRKVAKKYKDLSLSENQKLLDHSVHEVRFCALVILALQYPNSSEKEKQSIFDLYLQNLKKNNINNWDLVDVSAHKIVGLHLLHSNKNILFDLAKSDNLWERRVSVVSTFSFIKNKDCETTIKLSELLINDKHDLIHKATGWMLREVGKNCGEDALIGFLNKHYGQMPRTMLRYSIEKLNANQRDHYLGRSTKKY